MTDKPTEEQLAAMDAIVAGGNVVVQAGAGSGKTRMARGAAYRIRHANPRHGEIRYLTYNTAMARAAERSFPKFVRCSTVHSLAFRPVGAAYADRDRVPLGGGQGAPRQYGWQVAQILGITRGITCDQMLITGKRLGSLVIETLKQWCFTTDREIRVEHVPAQRGLSPAGQAELAAHVVKLARKAWLEQVCDLDGQINVQHDFYLKMWWLSGKARLDQVATWILDEAQDANALAAAIIQEQRGQLVAIGDSAQSIYDWRGAVDALETWPNATTLYLTQSFRFGPDIADWANQILSLIGTKIRLRGTPGIASTVGPVDAPHAVLCRTNAGAVELAIAALNAGRKPALASGGYTIKNFAEAAVQIQDGRRTGHPDLAAFATWEDVQRYVEEPEGQDLATLVELVDKLGAAELIELVDKLSHERNADVVFCTVHGAKGLEWPTVRIGSDFHSPGWDGDGRRRPVSKSAGRVMYVAVTRPQLGLDVGSLAWVPEWADDPTVRTYRYQRTATGVSQSW